MMKKKRAAELEFLLAETRAFERYIDAVLKIIKQMKRQGLVR